MKFTACTVIVESEEGIFLAPASAEMLALFLPMLQPSCNGEPKIVPLPEHIQAQAIELGRAINAHFKINNATH